MTLVFERENEALDLTDIVGSAADALENAPAEEIVRWAIATFGERICVTSSMKDAVLVDIAAKIRPGIDVLFVDTGYHFAETIGTRDAVEAVYPIHVVNATSSRTVAEQERDLGPRLNGRNPDLCCHLRKVEPLNRALEPYLAWITGIRREETSHRADAKVVEWNAARRKVKVNPLARWTHEELTSYIRDHDILVNPLQYDGYPSIGCEPCTQRVEPGEDPRSGRWAGTGKSECGINL
jgi:phosphoadenosine phosphosulfate reductase